MAIINATPHPIAVRKDNEVTVFAPCGSIARVQATFTTSKEVEGGFETFTIEYGEISGLPKIGEEDFVIVSSLVLEAAKASNHHQLNRLLAPATGHPAVNRNEKGHIESVPGFVRA